LVYRSAVGGEDFLKGDKMEQSEKQDRDCRNCKYFKALEEEGGHKLEIIDDFCLKYKVPDNDDKFCDAWEEKDKQK
jgi:hypothetical protein